jgi:hypothetical protein
VIGRDLNFKLEASKLWEPTAQTDHVSRYFLRKLEEVGMLYIEPTKLYPTQRNKIIEVDIFSKRFDQFLISNGFLDEFTRVKQWVASRGDSNHHQLA